MISVVYCTREENPKHKEHIRKNFLTTRLMNDWLSLANHHLHKKNILVEFEEIITKLKGF